MARLHFARFGPAIDIVPVSDFSRMSLSDDQWANAWRLCGPSAARNMTGTTKRGPLELWQVIAAAYLEGLHHGHEMAKTQTDQR
jgi:hypothetical protein